MRGEEAENDEEDAGVGTGNLCWSEFADEPSKKRHSYHCSAVYMGKKREEQRKDMILRYEKGSANGERLHPRQNERECERDGGLGKFMRRKEKTLFLTKRDPIVYRELEKRFIRAARAENTNG